jgi:nucleoid DNA-binding protein
MTGFDKLASETGLTSQKVRTSLNRLKSTNEITVNSSTQGTVIQIVNYGKYQVATDDQQTNNKPITNEQQTDNKPITTNKNVNNEKNDKELKETKAFNEFWDLYDKKINPTKCKPKFLKLSDKDRKLIMEYIPKYKLSQPNKKFRKDPLTFLNNDGWLDEIITEQKEESKPFIYKY